MIKFRKFIFSPFAENTYIIWDDSTLQAAAVDPGCSNIEEEDILADFIEEKRLNLKYLINTHCHVDHIFGNSFVKERYEPRFLAPEKDLFLLNNLREQAQLFGIDAKSSPQPDSFISEETEIELGKEKGNFLFTPGHTPGEFSLYFPDSLICLTGDVLFRESIGRTDLWQGDYDTLIRSIKERLFQLPKTTLVLPGHGETTTIEHEMNYNPFLI